MKDASTLLISGMLMGVLIGLCLGFLAGQCLPDDSPVPAGMGQKP